MLAHADRAPGLGLAAHEPQPDRAIGGGENRAGAPPEGALAQAQLRARRARHRGRPGQAQPAQMAVWLAAVIQARDRLLADVAPPCEPPRALVQPALRGDPAVVEAPSVAGAPALDAHDL